ncbi:MAG: Rieske (2Fe-2S) protein [Candidatus Dormibacteria bacterium]
MSLVSALNSSYGQGQLGLRLHALAERVSRVEALDAFRDLVAPAVHTLTDPPAIKTLLSGSAIGHQLHPILTDLPIGFWTSALVLDMVGGEDSQDAADLLVGLGCISAVGAAASGVSDWSDSSTEEQRVGLVHAGLNIGAVALFAASYALRKNQAREAGVALGWAGAALATASAFLGGHLVYGRGVGVTHAGYEALPAEWTAVIRESELSEDKPRLVEADGVAVVLLRHGEEVHALANSCSHAGGPLSDGTVDGCSITCPWHGSTFSVEDGSIERGPASVPQRRFEVRTRDGQVEVRAAV